MADDHLEKGGDRSTRVELTGWTPGALKISANKAVQAHTNLGLVAAKDVIDDCLAHRKPVVNVRSRLAAGELIDELAQHGFDARVLSDDV